MSEEKKPVSASEMWARLNTLLRRGTWSGEDCHAVAEFLHLSQEVSRRELEAEAIAKAEAKRARKAEKHDSETKVS